MSSHYTKCHVSINVLVSYALLLSHLGCSSVLYWSVQSHNAACETSPSNRKQENKGWKLMVFTHLSCVFDGHFQVSSNDTTHSISNSRADFETSYHKTFRKDPTLYTKPTPRKLMG